MRASQGTPERTLCKAPKGIYAAAAISSSNPLSIWVTILLTIAVGDIHGCFGALQRLFVNCEALGGAQETEFICIGDYIDRGAGSRKVIDLLMARKADGARRFVCLRGNHEEMLLRAADRNRSDHDLMTWWGNGGEATLESYGVNDPSDLPAEHLDWMRNLPLHTSDAHRLYVHAGIRPGIALASQSNEDLLWIREPFLSSAENHGAFVVHGHTPTPSRKPDGQTGSTSIPAPALAALSQRPCSPKGRSHHCSLSTIPATFSRQGKTSSHYNCVDIIA